MNYKYDTSSLRKGLYNALGYLQAAGQKVHSGEIGEALHLLGVQDDWIKKALPALYHLRTEVQEADRISGDGEEAVQLASTLLNDWTPPPTHQVSFDGENWIDLPYDTQAPGGMKVREKVA